MSLKNNSLLSRVLDLYNDRNSNNAKTGAYEHKQGPNPNILLLLIWRMSQKPHSPHSSRLSLATKLNPPKGFDCASPIKSSNFFVRTGLSGRSVKSCAKFSASSGSVMSGIMGGSSSLVSSFFQSILRKKRCFLIDCRSLGMLSPWHPR
jgi:hypothetical protein